MKDLGQGNNLAIKNQQKKKLIKLNLLKLTKKLYRNRLKNHGMICLCLIKKFMKSSIKKSKWKRKKKRLL